MTIDWWTLGLQTVNVLILIWILARFLFKPVGKIIAERQKAAHAALDEAEAAKADALAARDEANAQTAEMAARRAALVAQAQEEATREKDRLLAEARAEAEKLRAEGAAELDHLRAAQTRAMADQAGKLATDIAAKLFARLPETARIAGFIDGLVEAVADLPEATRAGIGAEAPVQIRAARPLTHDERASLGARLTDVLGRDVELNLETDPDLIAGLELDAPHAIVRNHFRADLDRIRTELTGND